MFRQEESNTLKIKFKMTKVHSSFDASYLMEQISKYAPVALLLFAFLSFLAVGIFTVDYYDNLFRSRFGRSATMMAILIAVIQEAVRFGLLVTSVKDFRDGKKLNGSIGLLGSIGLVLHDISVTNRIANLWSSTDPLPYSSLFLFLILIGLLVEFRLILTISTNEKKQSSSQSEETPGHAATSPVPSSGASSAGSN